MTQETETERAAQPDSQVATAHNHVALTDDELGQVAAAGGGIRVGSDGANN